MRDLEMTKQEANEDFTIFVARWRAKVSKVKNRPAEEDQVQMVIRNLQPKDIK